LADSLRLVLFLGLPATVGLILLGEPLIRILFQLPFSEAALVSWALLFYSLGLVPLAAIEVVSRAFYALGDTRTPVFAGAAQLVAMAGLGYTLGYGLFPALGWLEHGGLAVAASLANLLELLLLLFWLRPKVAGIDGRHLLDGCWRMGLASLAMAVVVWAVRQLQLSAGPLLLLLAGAGAGATTYFAASLVFRVAELYQLLAYARRRLAR
jgi:putative peptidoglycan lipid II flippase